MNEKDYEQAVNAYYEGLYRFGYSLAGNADDAGELTQETFARLLTKGGQLRDHSRLKAWLFTTLYRIYLGWKRQETRHPHFDLASVEAELPVVTPDLVDRLANDAIRQALLDLDERYRVPLALYYFDNRSYAEISELLDVPIGTIMSRLARAKELMRKSLAAKSVSSASNVISLNPATPKNSLNHE